MKKFILMLVVALGISVTTNAQKKGEKLSIDEKVSKKLEKLTSELNLTDAQVQQITPILKERAIEKDEMSKKRKALKESGVEPTEEQKAAFKEKRKERSKYYRGEMEKILTADQIAKLKELKKKKRAKKKALKEGKACDGAKAKSCEGKE